jgi:hypothetical protein
MRIKLATLACYFVLSCGTASTAETIEGFSVDREEKPSILLRHGKAYYFNNALSTGENEIYVQKYTVTFFEGGDYNEGNSPTFSFTDEAESLNNYFPSRFNGKFIESNPNHYFIKYRPEERKDDNLKVTYETYLWSRKNRSAKWEKYSLKVDVQPYTITWCGDGVRDDYIDAYNGEKVSESCDPNDPARIGWRDGVCSKACD